MIRISSFFGALGLAIIRLLPRSLRTSPRPAICAWSATAICKGAAPISRWIHQQGDRWIAYIGHHGGIPESEKPINPLTGQAEFNGTSIIDVTDPAHPKYLAHIPGEAGNYEAGGAQMVRVCDGKSLPKGDPSAVYLLRPFGNQAHEIWNTADPAHPKLVDAHRRGAEGHA